MCHYGERGGLIAWYCCYLRQREIHRARRGGRLMTFLSVAPDSWYISDTDTFLLLALPFSHSQPYPRFSQLLEVQLGVSTYIRGYAAIKLDSSNSAATCCKSALCLTTKRFYPAERTHFLVWSVGLSFFASMLLY